MSRMEKVYELEEQKSADGLQFLFESTGQNNVIKAIQYSYVMQFGGKAVYNLGFGDYHPETDSFIDEVNTNNGDVYTVFNTVLSSIPRFFERFSQHCFIVSGSDSTEYYIENCKASCIRHCGEKCKKANRRISIYRAYVDKYYDVLSIEYDFFGGFNKAEEGIILEPYRRFKQYDSVLVIKKNV